MNIKQIVNRHQESIRFLSLFIICAFFFLSVVGSYRFFIVYGLYFFLKGLKLEYPVRLVFFPAFVITFYLDVTNGPILQPDAKSHFLPMLLLFFIVGSIAEKVLKRLIIYLSEGKLFLVCPSCRFYNLHIVEKCGKCSYQKGMLSLENPTISSSFSGDKVKPSLLGLLRASTSEEILFYKKLTSDTRTLKNGNRLVRKHLFLTASHLTLLGYYGLFLRKPNGWREKDIIQLSDFVSVEWKRKRVYYAWRPSLIICTANNDVYEIVLSSFGSYIGDINHMVAIINNANPNIKTNVVDLADVMPGYSERDRRLLLMLPLILLLLALALWQLFQHKEAWP